MPRLATTRPLAVALLGLLSCVPEATVTAPESPSADYAESVGLMAVSLDGSQELGVRLSRRPGRETGSVWVSAFLDGRSYTLSDGAALGDEVGKTAVEEEGVEFRVFGESRAGFSSRRRHSPAMVGSIRAGGRAHESLHPPPGPGSVPLEIEATFEASGKEIRVRPGRLEVFGRVRATVSTSYGVYRLDLPGKWHEQTGERPSFAPPFIYFAVQGEEASLLARGGPGTPWGYLKEGDIISRVASFEIDPYGAERRSFRIGLEDGRSIEGTALVLRQGSVPVEGQRRPGATVRVESSVGEMVGHLNDWNPDPGNSH